MAKRWRGFTSGANIPNARVYICAGCQVWHNEPKPGHCISCGRMDFIHFPSKAEAKRYGELMLEKRAGLISDLKLQPQFVLHAGQIKKTFGPGSMIATNVIPVKIGAYRGDFGYKRGEVNIIEDVKGGADTPLSAWKRKHAEAEHGIKINIVRR